MDRLLQVNIFETSPTLLLGNGLVKTNDTSLNLKTVITNVVADVVNQANGSSFKFKDEGGFKSEMRCGDFDAARASKDFIDYDSDFVGNMFKHAVVAELQKKELYWEKITFLDIRDGKEIGDIYSFLFIFKVKGVGNMMNFRLYIRKFDGSLVEQVVGCHVTKVKSKGCTIS